MTWVPDQGTWKQLSHVDGLVRSPADVSNLTSMRLRKCRRTRLVGGPDGTYIGLVMLDRCALVTQMAKAFVGEGVLNPVQPDEALRQRAEEALARVELYLGVDVEEAKDIVTRVMEDVS